MSLVDDWALPGMKEMPFWRDGMTVEEYDIERYYWQGHYNTLEEKINFKSLYEQREECRDKKGDWASPTLKNAPFWREGMTQEEFDTEAEYYLHNYFNLVEIGKYKPLWKQKEEASN